jgi:hypothetical protein
MATKINPHEDGRNAHDAGLNAAQCPYEYTKPAKSKEWRAGWWERFWEVNGTDLGPPETWGTWKKKDTTQEGNTMTDRLAEFHKQHQKMHVHFRNELTKEAEEVSVWLAVNAVPYLIEQIDALTTKAHAATNEYAALLIAERAKVAALEADVERLTNAGLECAYGETIKADEANDYAAQVEKLEALVKEAAIAIEWANVLMPPVELKEWDATCRKDGVGMALLTRLQESNATV